MALIALDGVSKFFGAHRALFDVTLGIEKGDFTVFTGSNGAGKSTLLSLLSGTLRADRGRVFIAGFDPAKAADFSALKRAVRIGISLQPSFLYGELNLEENLRLSAELHRLPRPDEAVSDAAALLGLDDFLHKSPRECSSGIKRRASLARAVLHDPELLILDEPLANLDAEGRVSVIAMLRRFREEGSTVILAGHEEELKLDGLGRVFELRNGVLDSGSLSR